jgi:regulator of protease activity HflC (stomatin/prohibitin superfamily)
MNRFLLGLVFVMIVGAVIVLNTSGFVVKTGNVGLVVNHYTGKVDTHIRHAGFNAQPPFSGNELIEIPTYERTYTMVRDSTEGAHSDDSVLTSTLSSNTLNVDTSITYHIAYDPKHPENLIALYRKYRNQFTDFSAFEDAQLRPAFRQAIVDAFGLASTTQDMTGAGKRAAAAYAFQELNTRFNPDSLVVDEVRIRAIYPDTATVAALRSRLQAQQDLKLAQLGLQLQQLTSQREVLAAQAQAQAVRIRAASLTSRLVRSRHIKDIQIIGVPAGAIVSVPPDTAPTPANDTTTAPASSQ